MNIGIIGFGNMAQAITRGWRRQGRTIAIHACARDYDKLCRNAEPLGVIPHQEAAEVIANAELIIIAVKPYQVADVVAPVRDLLKDKIVVSVAAGKLFDDLEAVLAPGTAHISTVPNTPIAVAEGLLITEDRHTLSETQYEAFKELFEAIALIVVTDADHFSIAGTVAGCAPAFTAMYIEALGDAGVKYGLARDTAYQLAAQMVAGTGKLYLANKEHPGAMKDAVCSPGGTTIKGVASLEKSAFRGTVIAAVDAIEG